MNQWRRDISPPWLLLLRPDEDHAARAVERLILRRRANRARIDLDARDVRWLHQVVHQRGRVASGDHRVDAAPVQVHGHPATVESLWCEAGYRGPKTVPNPGYANARPAIHHLRYAERIPLLDFFGSHELTGVSPSLAFLKPAIETAQFERA